MVNVVRVNQSWRAIGGLAFHKKSLATTFLREIVAREISKAFLHSTRLVWAREKCSDLVLRSVHVNTVIVFFFRYGDSYVY